MSLRTVADVRQRATAQQLRFSAIGNAALRSTLVAAGKAGWVDMSAFADLRWSCGIGATASNHVCVERRTMCDASLQAARRAG